MSKHLRVVLVVLLVFNSVFWIRYNVKDLNTLGSLFRGSVLFSITIKNPPDPAEERGSLVMQALGRLVGFGKVEAAENKEGETADNQSPLKKFVNILQFVFMSSVLILL